MLPVLCLTFAAVGACGAPSPNLDETLLQAQQVEDLLSRMTLEEKVGQMCQYLGSSRLPQHASPRGADDDTTPSTYEGMSKADVLNRVRAGQIGSVLNFYGDSVAESNELQQAAVESRLKIPLLFGADAVHGHAMTPGTTVFPTAIGLAATFDEELVRRVGRVTAAEMRATGFNWCWGPNVEVVRDQRWGRVGETFGEDPLLVARLGVATVRGLQGDLIDPETDVLACAKHFIGGSQPIGGQNHAPADLSERALREVFLPPFAACVRAGVYSVMVAHNEVNGVPCHANSYLLTDVLKGELGFKGVVISDWMDVSRLWTTQHIAANMAEASELAVRAGLDVHMHGPGFYEAIVAAVQAGRLPLDRIDDAVRRILRAKFAAGLFAHPFSDPTLARQQLATPENMALALQAARESIVLLRNEGGILPLRRNLKRIFVTGPNAADTSPLGDWSSVKNADRLITMAAGLEHVLGDPGRIDRFDCGNFAAITDATLQRAAERARGADVAVLFVGGHPHRGGGPGPASEGENFDRFDLGLPGRQLELVQAVHATGVPTVVVLLNGGAIAEPWLAENIPALLDAFYPGQPGGQAVAEVLFGDVNPSGRLPYSVPRGAGALPGYYYERPGFYSPQGVFADLGPDQSKTPLFPFGFGLSYTTFTYSNLRVPAHTPAGHDVTVTYDLKNTGTRPGSEVVLTFVSDLLSSVTMPAKLLKGFQHVYLEPGEKKSISLTLPGDAFALLNARLQSVVEPGPFAIAVGDQRILFSITAD